MKEELIAYATNTLIYSNAKKSNQSFLFSDTTLGVCVAIVLGVASIPLLFKRLYIWIALLILWILMLVFRAKEKDAYIKAILIDVMSILSFSIFCSFVLLQSQKADSFSPLSLIVISAFYLLLYEIFILIRIKQKKYSHRKQSVFSKKSKESNPRLIYSVSCLGGFGGVILSRLTSNLIPSFIYRIVFVNGISLLWLCGCILIQKYLILKILNKNN